MPETRERIVAATNELFRRHGYHATTLKQIADASGATIGSIYHFFPGGKEELGVAVIDTTGKVYRELFEAFADDPTEPLRCFGAFFDGAAEVLEQSHYIDPCPIGTVAREVANSSEPLRLAADRAFRSWIAAAHRFLVDAGIDEVTANTLATAFVTNVEGAFVLSRTARTTDPVRAVEQLVAMSIEAALARQRPRMTTKRT